MPGAGKAAGSLWPPWRPPSRSMRSFSPSGSPHPQQPARMQGWPPTSLAPARHLTSLPASESRESSPVSRPRGPNRPTHRPNPRGKTRRHRSPMIRGPHPTSSRENRRPQADLRSREPRDRHPRPGSSPASRIPYSGERSGIRVLARSGPTLCLCARPPTVEDRHTPRRTPGRSTHGRLETPPDDAGAPPRG